MAIANKAIAKVGTEESGRSGNQYAHGHSLDNRPPLDGSKRALF
jgi:hypothetical protein